MTLTVGSLFSGIGGIDLGLERAGMTVKWHSEIDPYACRVLKKHWPTTPNLGNIKDIDWSSVEPVDLIAGGYPCQPFSTAGKRQGEKDERHLWPYFLRAIGELRPRYAFLENVRGHLSMGFDRVLGDLAEIGYDAEWQIVSAASVGAPHRRDRIICVAYPSELFSDGGNNYTRISMESETVPELGNSGGSTNVADPNNTSGQQQCEWEVQKSDIGGRSENVADPNNTGSGTSQCGINSDRSEESQERKFAQSRFSGRSSEMANTASEGLQGCIGKVFEGNGTRSTYGGWQWWEVEPDVGRVAHGIPSRVDRLRGLGNAVVPQVAEYVGRLIMEAHNV